MSTQLYNFLADQLPESDRRILQQAQIGASQFAIFTEYKCTQYHISWELVRRVIYEHFSHPLVPPARPNGYDFIHRSDFSMYRKCPWCAPPGFMSRNRSSMITHIELQHPTKKLYGCGCGFGFISKRAYKSHCESAHYEFSPHLDAQLLADWIIHKSNFDVHDNLLFHGITGATFLTLNKADCDRMAVLWETILLLQTLVKQSLPVSRDRVTWWQSGEEEAKDDIINYFSRLRGCYKCPVCDFYDDYLTLLSHFMTVRSENLIFCHSTGVNNG